MKIIIALYSLCLLVSCNAKNSISNPEVAKIKKQHDQRQKILRLGFDPYYDKVPDSMKKWIKVFSNVLADDQKYRILGHSITKAEAKEQHSLDSQNLIIVTNFIDKYGWPAKFDAGFICQRAVGIVIQHSPLKIQEKYYPSLVQTYKRDPSLFETLAMLEDRINLLNNRCQFYGTQVVFLDGKYILYPVTNIDSMEIYRNRLGKFIPFNKYMEMLKVDWNIDDYKKNISNYKRKLNVSDTLGIHYLD